MPASVLRNIAPVSEVGSASSPHTGSRHSQADARHDAPRKSPEVSIRGEVTRILQDGVSVVRLPDKEITLRLPSSFAPGDAIYGLFASDGSWTAYAVPAAVARKNTAASVLELFGLPQNYLYRLSVESLLRYMPAISKGDIAAFVAAAEFIATEFHLPESDVVGLVTDLHSNGSPLSAAAMRKAMPSTITQAEFSHLLADLTSVLDHEFLPFQQRLVNLLAVAGDASRDARERLKLFLLGPTGNNETLFGLLAELMRTSPPAKIAEFASKILEALESRYFMNLCALAAGLPMRLWIALDNYNFAEISIQRTQKEKSILHTVSLLMETDELGITGIHLASYERQITARIYAAQDKSRDILAEEAEEFAQALGAIGFSRQSVSVTTGVMPPPVIAARSEIRLSI